MRPGVHPQEKCYSLAATRVTRGLDASVSETSDLRGRDGCGRSRDTGGFTGPLDTPVSGRFGKTAGRSTEWGQAAEPWRRKPTTAAGATGTGRRQAEPWRRKPGAADAGPAPARAADAGPAPARAAGACEAGARQANARKTRRRAATKLGTAAAATPQLWFSAERSPGAAAALSISSALRQSGAAADLYRWRVLSVRRYRLSQSAAGRLIWAAAAAAVWVPDGVLRWLCCGLRSGYVFHREHGGSAGELRQRSRGVHGGAAAPLVQSGLTRSF